MAFEPKTWADGEDGGTPITAEELNRIEAGISDAQNDDITVAWGDVTGKPSAFAPAAHTHEIADVTGLQDALDAKAGKVNQGQYSMLEAGTDTAGRPWAAKDIVDYVNAQIAAAVGASE